RRGDRMTRREFITLLGGAAAWPLAARAQQPMALVGLLTGVDLDDQRIGEIRQSLKDTGYVEGRNVAIKYRSAGGRLDRLPALAAELVADPVSVILTAAPPAALAAKAATDAFFGSRGDQLIELAARHAMPSMYYLRES